MTRFVYFAALMLLMSAGSASAQDKVRKNEIYCLQQGAGGGENGGAPAPLCNFETREQCLASKTANSDWCMLNPAISFNKRRS